jgi:hydrogenase expression/formation protein HypD
MENFNNPETGRALLQFIRTEADGMGNVRIMEVCGTHTMAIGRFGLRRLLPDNVRLVSGPGCPVCVTPAGVIDNAASLALERGVCLATYGDMVRVPGIITSLEDARARGADIRVITSPLDALSTGKETVFLAVGFETTAAPIAAVVKRILESGRRDVSLYCSIKVIPPALKVLQAMKDLHISGFLLPGHVSAVIGADAYSFLKLPAVIAGFEMNDVLYGILAVLRRIKSGNASLENRYTRVVRPEGNEKARHLLEEYFEPCSQPWRGLGKLPGCSLRLKDAFSIIDAERKYALKPLSDEMPEGCACGEVLQGAITPEECPQFGKACTPDAPLGPCMVSSEGSCAAWFKYERGTDA